MLRLPGRFPVPPHQYELSLCDPGVLKVGVKRNLTSRVLQKSFQSLVYHSAFPRRFGGRKTSGCRSICSSSTSSLLSFVKRLETPPGKARESLKLSAARHFAVCNHPRKIKTKRSTKSKMLMDAAPPRAPRGPYCCKTDTPHEGPEPAMARPPMANPNARDTPNFPTKIAWFKLSGKSPMDMRIPPLLKSIMLVGRLGVANPNARNKSGFPPH